MKARRVVITGLGVVSSIGIGAEAFWQSLKNGVSGCTKVTRFDCSTNKSQINCDVKNFDPGDYLDIKTAKRTSRFIQFALASAFMAKADAGLEIEERNSIGVYIGTGAGGFDALDDTYRTFLQKGPRALGPFAITNVIPNMAASNVAIALGTNGPCVAPVAACASGLHAIYDAYLAIKYGLIDKAFAGGAESTITSLVFAGYDALRVLSQNNDRFEHASRPFDRDRDGFVMGEGAGIILLEEYDAAVRRGASIYAEIASAELSCDASHITSPDLSGEIIMNTMRKAVVNGSADLDDVAYISAHGTSTSTNDMVEAKAIHKLNSELNGDVPVTAIKSMIGHTLGASGALALIGGVMSLREGLIPPTINTTNFDPAIDPIALVTQPTTFAARKEFVLTNAFGFGGHNACVLIKKIR